MSKKDLRNSQKNGHYCDTPNPCPSGSRTYSATDSEGFTLIEIIILIALAGILLTALIVPFVVGVRGSGKPEMVTKAMYLSHQRMEEFMKFNYSGVALTALTAYADADPVNFPNYQWQWEVTYVDDNFNAWGSDVGYKRILVRVRDPENSTYEVYSVVTNFP